MKLAEAIRQAGQHIVQANCLPQSLLLWSWLRWYGVPAQLFIGVNKQATTLAAHAWVELNGIGLAERSDVAEDFAAFDDLAIALEK